VDKFNQQLEHNKEEEVVENKTKKDDKPKALNKERQEQVMQMLNKGQLMYGGPNLMKRLSLKHENNQLLRKEMIEHTEIERVEEEKEIPPEVAPKPPKPKVTGTTTEVTNVIIDQETGMLESGRDRLVSKKRPIPKRNYNNVRPSHLITINVTEDFGYIISNPKDMTMEVLDVKTDKIEIETPIKNEKPTENKDIKDKPVDIKIEITSVKVEKPPEHKEEKPQEHEEEQPQEHKEEQLQEPKDEKPQENNIEKPEEHKDLHTVETSGEEKSPM